MTEFDGLVLAPEAASILGVDRKTLYRYSYTYGDFPQPAKIGSTAMYDPDQLRAWRKDHPAIGKRHDESPPPDKA